MTNSPITPNAALPTVADALLHYLSLENVDHLFGIPGGGLANLLTAFKNNRKQFNYIICRHETGAAYIADGYFRATGKLGVVIVTTGPGATNALTGVMNAQNDGSAMLLITGEVDESFFGLGYLQEGTDAKLNIDAIYTAATGYSAVITDSSNAEAILKQALRDALSVPCTSVHISVPNNVSVETIAAPAFASSVNNYRTTSKGVPLEEAEKAMQAITAAKRPLILLGNGCREAMRHNLKSLVKFVEYYGIPVITTADGKGIFPESHPLSLRVYGIADCMWPAYWMQAPANENKYDGLLVIGSSLGELSTNKWLPMLKPAGNAPFIQVDINPSVIGRSFPVTQGIVGEAGAFIRDLEKLIPSFPVDKKESANRKKIVAKIKSSHSPFMNPAQYGSTASPAEPAALMRCLQELLPADEAVKIFIDAGNCVGWGVHYLEVGKPWEIFSSLSMGPMGFAVGAALGAKIGCPNDICIGIVGDGAFLMFGAEVSTAKHYRAGVIWIVLNDNNLGMVSQGQAQFFPDNKDPAIWEELYELGNPDLVKYSQALGADAYLVNNPGELKKILPRVLKLAAKEKRPQVVVANINKSSVPPYYEPQYSPAK